MSTTTDPVPRTVIGKALAHPFAMWFVLGAATIAAIFIFFKGAAPGVAIALLALVALFMTFATPNEWQKAGVIVLATVLFVLEVRNVNTDRADANAKFNAERAASDRRFQDILADDRTRTSAILDSSNRQFAALESNFRSLFRAGQAVQRSTADNLRIERSIQENITGGDSYVAVIPIIRGGETTVPLLIQNRGNQIVTGLHVTEEYKGRAISEFDIGTIPPHEIRAVPKTYWPKPQFLDEFTYETWQQNGRFLQYLDFVWDDCAKKFLSRYTIYKIDPNKPMENKDMRLARKREQTDYDKQGFAALMKCVG